MNMEQGRQTEPQVPMLLRLKRYIDKNYYFRNQKEYQGFWGRLYAWADSGREEEHEKLNSREHYWEGRILGSSPFGLEEARQAYEAEYKVDNFSVYLLKLIQDKGLDHVTVYKNARIDRKLFSKIRTNIYYLPSKRTILALALSLHLTREETDRMLRYAGYSLSDRILLDVIIAFFIGEGIYDLDEINEALVKHKVEPFI